MKKLILPILMVAAMVAGCTSAPEDTVVSMEQAAVDAVQNITAICGGYAGYADDNGKGEFDDVFNECMNLAKEMVRDASR